MEIFTFCPKTNVPELLPREQPSVMSMGGWTFTSKPTTPYVKTYKVTLHGLKWFLTNDGYFVEGGDATLKARLLEKVYERHELWRPFLWTHQHLGQQALFRFKTPVIVPKALPNSDGLIEPLEVQLIEHNPGYGE